MTDKRIKSFLEDRLKRLESIRNKREWTTAELGDIACCKQTLAFIDTLEVKEVDLEEKATQLSQKYFPDEENIWARPNIEAQRCKSACIEIVKWLKAQKGEEV